MQNGLVDNAEVMASGQVTLPREIRDALGVGAGDTVTFISNDDHVILMNSAVYAMKMLQAAMRGEAQKSGLNSEEDVEELVRDLRSEENI